MEEKEPFLDRISHAWDVFRNGSSREQQVTATASFGASSYSRNDRARFSRAVDRTIVASLYTKIATDVAAVQLKHVKVDVNGRYKETMKSRLNRCLSIEANLDQTGRELIFDAVVSMFDEGHVAIVPVETVTSLKDANAYDIEKLRVGKVTQWYPKHVKVEVYDENDGKRKEVFLPKDKVALIENPFYAVMNEKNSTLKRLIQKINLLDNRDIKQDPSKLNMILQLPYVIKSETRKQQAKKRRDELEAQLSESQYGIAYVDGTEKIHQLNGSIDNTLLDEIKELKEDLYSQLGITKEVFNGSADEATMLNYRNSTVEPILSAFANEFIRKFLTKTAQTQGQTIQFIQDPFRLVPISQIAEIADKFTRNEIAAPNEIRSIVGMQPVDDPQADELRNRNLNQSNGAEESPNIVEDEEREDQEEYY